LIGGQIPLAVLSFSTTLSYHRSGKVRVLAVFNDKRSKTALDVPTAVESGVPGMVAVTFNVLLAPVATPRPIVDRIYRSMMKVMDDANFQKELEDLGIEPVADSNPDKAAIFIKSEITKWAALVKSTGIKEGP
jgi:tripartite-type tricarboxylate transporter receptor subunit TctC